MKKDTKEVKDYKRMPYNIEAEQATLGSILINNDISITIMAELKPEDFYSRAHQKIFQVMTELYAVNRPLDFVSVTDILNKEGELDGVGGIDYITQLTNAVPSAANYKHYLDIVKRDSLLRKLIISGQEIIENGYSSQSAQEALDRAEKLIFDISKTEYSSSLEHISESLKNVIEKFTQIQKDPSSLRGLPTGFTGIDDITNGFQPSDLILLAARPSVGKTALAMNMVTSAAVNAGKSCAIFSLEMPKTQVAQRAICSIGGISMEKALKGELSVEEWTRAINASRKLSEANIYIDDSGMTRPMEILSKCRRIKRERGLDLVMIDYLQLMAPDSNGRKNDSKQNEVADISRMLKMTARELNVPIILLSQLSRDVEKRKGDHVPMLSDLRDSGAIEQDADIVMFIYKAEKYNDVVSEDDPDVAEIIIAKHRNGKLGSVKLRWVGETTTFINMDYKKNISKPKTVVSQNVETENATKIENEDELQEVKNLFEGE